MKAWVEREKYRREAAVFPVPTVDFPSDISPATVSSFTAIEADSSLSRAGQIGDKVEKK
jgi:hypothetical protein